MLGSILHHAAEAVIIGDYATDQATLDVYLAAVRTWREAMLGAGKAAPLMTGNLRDLEAAQEAGFGQESIYAQHKTNRASAGQPSAAGWRNLELGAQSGIHSLVRVTDHGPPRAAIRE